MGKRIGIVGCVLLLLVSASAGAATERYDYDPAGRLIRRIDDQNRATEYLYDAAGNIIQVTAPGVAPAPAIAGGSLGDFRRNEIRPVSLAGSGLAGISVRSSDPGIVVSNLVQSATAINFVLAVGNATPLGAQQLIFENAAGSVRLGLNVIPGLAFAFEPSPVTLAPDGIARRVTVRLAEALSETMSFSLTTLSPAIAKAKTGTISIAAGQTQADFGVIGVASGATVLRLGNPALVEPVESLVFVSPGAATPSSMSAAVRINRGLPWTAAASLGFSPPIIVHKGTPWFESRSAAVVSAPVAIRKGGVPWFGSTAGGTVFSDSLLVHRGPVPWLSQSAATMTAKVSIQRWVPWSAPGTAGPVVSPPVTIVRQ